MNNNTLIERFMEIERIIDTPKKIPLQVGLVNTSNRQGKKG